MAENDIKKEYIVRPIVKMKKSGKLEGYPKHYQDVLVFFPIQDEYQNLIKENETWECEIINKYFINKPDKHGKKIYQNYLKPIRKIVKESNNAAS